MSKKRVNKLSIVMIVLVFVAGFLFGLGQYFLNRPNRVEREWSEQIQREHRERLDILRAEFSVDETGFPTGFTDYNNGAQLNLGMNIEDISELRVPAEAEEQFRAENDIPENTILLGFRRVHTVVFYGEQNTVTGIVTNSWGLRIVGGIRVGDDVESVAHLDSLDFTTDQHGRILSIQLLDSQEQPEGMSRYEPFRLIL